MTSRLLGRQSTGAIPSGGLEIYWRGWLSKCGHRKKSWKQRFFVLSNRGGAAMEYVCSRRVLCCAPHESNHLEESVLHAGVVIRQGTLPHSRTNMHDMPRSLQVLCQRKAPRPQGLHRPYHGDRIRFRRVARQRGGRGQQPVAGARERVLPRHHHAEARVAAQLRRH